MDSEGVWEVQIERREREDIPVVRRVFRCVL